MRPSWDSEITYLLFFLDIPVCEKIPALHICFQDESITLCHMESHGVTSHGIWEALEMINSLRKSKAE